MTKTEARTCFGCKGICSLSKGKCAFGFKVRHQRIGEGTDERVLRIPIEPCFKATTDKKFMEVAEYLDGRVVA